MTQLLRVGDSGGIRGNNSRDIRKKDRNKRAKKIKDLWALLEGAQRRTSRTGGGGIKNDPRFTDEKKRGASSRCLQQTQQQPARSMFRV